NAREVVVEHGALAAAAELFLIRRLRSMSKSKQLQKQIDDAIKAMAEVVPTQAGSDVRAARLHSEIFVAASQLAEISTRRVVHLTWALVVLTVALLFFAIALYED